MSYPASGRGREAGDERISLPPDESSDVTVLGHGKHVHDMANRAIYACNLPRSVRFLTLAQHFALECDDIYPDQSRARLL
jgi:hypothetical protein